MSIKVNGSHALSKRGGLVFIHHDGFGECNVDEDGRNSGQVLLERGWNGLYPNLSMFRMDAARKP